MAVQQDHPTGGIDPPIAPSDAAVLLDVINGTRRRAKEALNHSWLVAVLLGLVLLVGTQVDRLLGPSSIGARGCPRGRGAASAVACAGVIQAAQRTPLAARVSPHATFSTIVGRVLPAWSVGTSWLYWSVALAVILGILMLAQMRQSSLSARVRFFGAVAGALGLATGADLMFRHLSPVGPLANVASAGVAIGLIAVVAHGRGLAVVGAAALVTAAALSHLMPDVVLSGQKLTLPSWSAVQAITGAVLIGGGAALRWRTGTMSWRPRGGWPSSSIAGG